MIRRVFTVLPFVSVFILPWPVTAVLALCVAVFEPLVPLAAGILFDTLYFLPGHGAWPLATVLGALATAAAFFVRSRLKTSIIGG